MPIVIISGSILRVKIVYFVIESFVKGTTIFPTQNLDHIFNTIGMIVDFSGNMSDLLNNITIKVKQ